MTDRLRRQALAEFLRIRRARLTPSDVGLPEGGRRRTPGLRREEVAQVANVGVSWYTLLEQGRDIRPSIEILHSIATALRLTPDERQHLFLLADQQYLALLRPLNEEVSPALRRVLNALDPHPAYVMGRRWDYLAWNTAAECIFSPSKISAPYDHNIIWRIFTDPERRLLNPQWEQITPRILAEFRADSVRYAEDDTFKHLIADLQHVSPEFRLWWSRHDVRGTSDIRKDIEHPLVGRLMFEHTTLQVPSAPDQKVMIYTPLPGTDTEAKLRRLIDDVAVPV